MRVKLTLFCFFLLPATLWAGGYNLRFKVSERNFADSIAIEDEGGRVFVTVTIGGAQRRFLLDTGAAQTVVYDDTELSHCPQVGTIRSTDALGAQAVVPMVALPPLRMGRLLFTGMQATVHQRPSQGQHIDGIVGFDIVCKGLSMKIDVAQRLLILTDRKKHFNAERAQTIEIPYQVLPFRHTPYVDVQPFQGYTEQVLFDTGSPYLYRMNKASFEQGLDSCLAQNPEQIEGTTTGSFLRGLHGQEASGQVTLLRLDRLQWGTFSFYELSTRTTQGLSHLGGPVLDYGSVVFLPHRKRLLFQPY